MDAMSPINASQDIASTLMARRVGANHFSNQPSSSGEKVWTRERTAFSIDCLSSFAVIEPLLILRSGAMTTKARDWSSVGG